MLRFRFAAVSSLALALLGACSDAAPGAHEYDAAVPPGDASFSDASAGDGSFPSGDAGLVDGALQQQTVITFAGANPLAVPAGQDVVARFLVTTDGLPDPFVVVGFAIDGTAADTSLDHTASITDMEGYVEVTIRGGTIPTTFQLRTTSPDAPAMYVTVNVAGGTAAKATTP